MQTWTGVYFADPGPFADGRFRDQRYLKCLCCIFCKIVWFVMHGGCQRPRLISAALSSTLVSKFFWCDSIKVWSCASIAGAPLSVLKDLVIPRTNHQWVHGEHQIPHAQKFPPVRDALYIVLSLGHCGACVAIAPC